MLQYLDDALTTCERLLAQPDSQEWTQSCYTVGNILTGMGLIEEAYPWRVMALAKAPVNARFYAESGRIYSCCEAWLQAVQAWEQTLVYQPDNVEVRHRLAKTYGHLGDRRAEAKTLHDILTSYPDKATATIHFQLGRLLELQGENTAAVDCYRRAIQRDPVYAAAYVALGNLYGRVESWETSLELYQSWAEQDPDCAEVYSQMGRAHRLLQQPEAAIEQFHRALQLEPTMYWPYVGLMNTLTALQRWQAALDVCQQAHQAVGEAAWVHSLTGNTLSRQGNYPAAAASHQRAFALQGWQQCPDRGYTFGETWFSDVLLTWQTALAELRNRPQPLHALVLGNCEAASLCWLADHLLRQPTDRCWWMSNAFESTTLENLDRVAARSQLELKTGLPIEDARSLDGAAFDVVCVQCEGQQADALSALMEKVWPYVNPGGVLIFQNALWHPTSYPEQAPRVGIAAFTSSVGQHIVPIEQSYHALYQRRTN